MYIGPNAQRLIGFFIFAVSLYAANRLFSFIVYALPEYAVDAMFLGIITTMPIVLLVSLYRGRAARRASKSVNDELRRF